MIGKIADVADFFEHADGDFLIDELVFHEKNTLGGSTCDRCAGGRCSWAGSLSCLKFEHRRDAGREMLSF